MNPRPTSLAEVARRAPDQHAFEFELSDFLHEFAREGDYEKLTERPPILRRPLGNRLGAGCLPGRGSCVSCSQAGLPRSRLDARSGAHLARTMVRKSRPSYARPSAGGKPRGVSGAQSVCFVQRSFGGLTPNGSRPSPTPHCRPNPPPAEPTHARPRVPGPLNETARSANR